MSSVSEQNCTYNYEGCVLNKGNIIPKVIQISSWEGWKSTTSFIDKPQIYM